MRKSIFERMSREYDLSVEADKINDLFSFEEVFRNESIEDHINNNIFRDWPYRGTFLDVHEYRKYLGIDAESLKCYLDINDYLLYFEYVINMMNFLFTRGINHNIDYVLKQMSIITDNIKKILDSINYTIYEEDDRRIIGEKNPAVTIVTELVDEISAKRIIEYNHFILKGQLQKKEEILSQLAKKLELYRKKLIEAGNKQLVSDTFFLLNSLNIRHNNTEGSNANFYVKSMSKDELESWYDKIYDLIITCIITVNYVDMKSDIDQLKQNICS